MSRDKTGRASKPASGAVLGRSFAQTSYVMRDWSEGSATDTVSVASPHRPRLPFPLRRRTDPGCRFLCVTALSPDAVSSASPAPAAGVVPGQPPGRVQQDRDLPCEENGTEDISGRKLLDKFREYRLLMRSDSASVLWCGNCLYCLHPAVVGFKEGSAAGSRGASAGVPEI